MNPLGPNWREEISRITFQYAIPFAGKVLGALVLWIIGRFIIGGIRRFVLRKLVNRKLDPTLTAYVDSMLGVILTILLAIAVLSIFGVETASFAGILAAAGVAIGMAWSGLLSNFAAGAFMLILRPFKVGDFVTAAGVTGTVREIGLFATKIDTADNILTMVGNAKIFADTIQNFTANTYRRAELTAQLPAGVDLAEAMGRIRQKLLAVPNVLKAPEPFVDLLEINPVGPVLAVRPFCHNDHYWDVYFATVNIIQEELARHPSTEPYYLVRRATS